MLDRLGADVFWNRINLLYRFEAQRCVASLRSQHAAEYKFRPGDVGFAWGGNSNAWFEFLRMQGVDLTPDELYLERRYKTMMEPGRAGKYCVVLSNIDHGEHQGKHLVCNLTTLGDMRFSPSMRTPMNNFFALAFGGLSKPWPPKFPPILTNPPWWRPAYLYAIPAIREVIPSLSLEHLSLVPGELDRLQEAVEDRVKPIPTRSENISWTTIQISGIKEWTSNTWKSTGRILPLWDELSLTSTVKWEKHRPQPLVCVQNTGVWRVAVARAITL
ncbi:hypothetical protein OE88DRAFT_939550 [Heliocybe sulcata]|uniref:Uncharacterized protein n=1 Tax=Heliocybe sulcata TaxID=5364 RepID=A0A5C3NF44_9AGAM|nr:hypothetical protein OE88DRAFT_939550 [Heliocybe sulcata]